jgi:hypothetical protein
MIYFLKPKQCCLLGEGEFSKPEGQQSFVNFRRQQSSAVAFFH